MGNFLNNIATSLGFGRINEVHKSTKSKNDMNARTREDLNKQSKDTESVKDTESKEKKSFKEVLDSTKDRINISPEGKEANESKVRMCNHDPNSEKTTLVKLPKRIMSYPPEVFMCCDVCRIGFRFVENKDGTLRVKGTE